MPVLNINEDEKIILVTALTHERVRLMKEWTRLVEDHDSSAYSREADCAEIDDHADAVTDLRRKIEVAADITKAAWHNEYGWLTKSFFESDRGKAAYKSALQAVQDNVTGLGLTPDEARDQMSPGKWTTLPDEVDPDGWMFDITDPDDKIVIASADTQTDGTVVGFHTFPTEADNAVSKGIWALITRNFSLASCRDMDLAKKPLKADPERLAAIKSSVEDLQRALAQDPKVKIDITVGGKTLTVDGHESLMEALSCLNRRSL